MLSPMRMHPYGVCELNRWVQATFRHDELERGRRWGVSLGDEEIVRHDKVIQTVNQHREGYDHVTPDLESRAVEVYLANGEIGLAATEKSSFLNVLFAGRAGVTMGYRASEFAGDGGPLELAYALTVHKAQGSDFGVTFVILPKRSRMLTTELLYTAFTRARRQTVLLVEGDDLSFLYELSLPDKSDTARRNSTLFVASVREGVEVLPYAEHLIHRTPGGQLVRSKSELLIATTLEHWGIPYLYERPLSAKDEPERLRPDFSFVDPAGDLILWEHLGMLSRPEYRDGWEWKQRWYKSHGFLLGKTLFTTEDDERGGLDAGPVEEIAAKVKALL